MLLFPELGLLSCVWFWPIASILGLFDRSALEGRPDHPAKSGATRP
jgi:hypothetical protein